MFAVISRVGIEDAEKARAALEDQRVSYVKKAPGFVCAYWLEPIDGEGLSMLVFESKEYAEAAAAHPVPPLPGVTLRHLEIREVYAQA
jgi:hypothetical protein